MTICIRASLIHMKNRSHKNTILGRGPRTYAALLKVSGFFAVPVLWMCVSWSVVVKPLFLPDPVRVIQAAWDIQHPNLFVHTVSTLCLIVSGYALGVVSGYTAGLLLRHSFIVRNFFTPIIETMRPVPAVALIPFFILWFGYSATGKIVLIAAGVFLIIVVGVVNAIDTLDPLCTRSGREQLEVLMARCTTCNSADNAWAYACRTGDRYYTRHRERIHGCHARIGSRHQLCTQYILLSYRHAGHHYPWNDRQHSGRTSLLHLEQTHQMASRSTRSAFMRVNN